MYKRQSIFSPISFLAPGKRPTILDLVTHIDYIVNLVGIDHVGFGSDTDERVTSEKWNGARGQFPEIYGDWSYENRRVEGYTSDACVPEITKALVLRGYSEADIHKILGGNLMRVFLQTLG